MYKKILIPTDGSKASERAIGSLKHVMNKDDGEIIVLSVAETITPHHFQSKRRIAELNSVIIDDAKEDAEAFKNKINVDVKITTQVGEGRPSDNILEVAEKEDVDLIIIASSGKSSLDRFRLGSVAEKVVSRADADVLVIH